MQFDCEDVINQLDKTQSLLILLEERLSAESCARNTEDELATALCLLHRIPLFENLISVIQDTVDAALRDLNTLTYGGDCHA